MALFNILVNIAAKTADLESGLSRVEKRLDSFGDTVKHIGETILAGAFAEGVKHILEVGDAMSSAAVKAGVTGKAFTELAYGAKLQGIGTDQLSGAFVKMNKAMSEASTGGSVALRALGLTFGDLRDKSPDQQMELLADRISTLQSPADKSRALIELFGKSGADLAPLFEKGAAGIRAARDEAVRLGASFSTEQLKGLEEAHQSITRLETAFSSLATTLVSKVAGPLTTVLDAISAIVADDKVGKLKLLTEAEDAPKTTGWILGGLPGMLYMAAHKKDTDRGSASLHAAAAAEDFGATPGGANDWDAPGSAAPGYAASNLAEFKVSGHKLTANDMNVDPFTAESAARLKTLQVFLDKYSNLNGGGGQTAANSVLQEFQVDTEGTLAKATRDFEKTKIEVETLLANNKLSPRDASDIMEEAAANFNQAIDISPIVVSAKRLPPVLSEAGVAVHEFVSDFTGSMNSALHQNGNLGKNFLRDLVTALTDRTLYKAISDIGDALLKALSAGAAASGGAGGAGGWLGLVGGAVMGSFSNDSGIDAGWGTGANANLAAAAAGFGGYMAEGGPLQAGKWYTAGEHGPEPIWGGGAGAFASGYGGNGGGSPEFNHTYNIDARGADAERIMAVMPGMLDQTREATKRDIIDAFRRNGYPAPRSA